MDEWQLLKGLPEKQISDRIMFSHLRVNCENYIFYFNYCSLDLGCREPETEASSLLDSWLSLNRWNNINLTSLPDLTSFPDLSTATSLKFVSVTSAHSLSNINGLAQAPNLEILLLQDTPQLKPARLDVFLNHPQLKYIYPCLDFDLDAEVNKKAERVLAPNFGTGLLDAEVPEFSFK
jgi:hypothetical protein